MTMRDKASSSSVDLSAIRHRAEQATPDQPLQRVQIVNRNHPHFEEYGRFTGTIVTMRFGTREPMAEVTLEHCRHGTDGCFVSKGDVIQVKERA